MKHPHQNTENFEFNLGQATELRCIETSGTTACSHCQNCKVRQIIIETRQWFPRAGEKSKRKLVHGLIRKSYSGHLLQYLIGILKPISRKDYGYTRSRPNPGLVGDRVDAGLDRALSASETHIRSTGLYTWFQDAPYWSKVNFLLAVLQMCDGQLLHSTESLCRTMLTAQVRGFSMRSYDGNEYELESLADTVYSYNSADHPENEWLRDASGEYSTPVNPFEIEDDLDSSHVTVDATTDEETDGDSEDSSIDPRVCVTPVSRRSLGGVMKYRDFIRDLPVHLSKYILSFMEYSDLVNCLKVSQHWHAITTEVEKDMRLRQNMWEEVMLMQGSSAKGGNPVYAEYIPVPVPRVVPGSFEIFISEHEPTNVNFKSEINLDSSYRGLITSPVNMEARNIYCGPYNVMVLSDQEDFNRIVHYNFGNLVAMGSFDRYVRFIDTNSGREVGPRITGHAGSIKCLFINEKDGFVLSGSFDTSIRCWSTVSGKPLKIFNGHQGTVKCLAMFEDKLVSGSKDKAVKVWDFSTGKCVRTFNHAKQINSVAIHEDTVVSGCDAGRVKVWSIQKACLIKMLYRSPRQTNQYGICDPHTHAGPITVIKVDRYHIASGSSDGYALIWSASGDITKCINAMRHPKEVLCLEMHYMRLVTGCEDGKLRIWNMLSGDCLRVMRGNSRSDPILTIHPCGNRLALNTINNLLILNFEEINLEYGSDEKIELLRYKNNFEEASLRHQSYAYVRANRSERAASANPKLVSHTTVSLADRSIKIKEGQLSHSSRFLSPKRLEHAKQIQRVVQNVNLTDSLKGSIYHNLTDVHSKSTSDLNKASKNYIKLTNSRTGDFRVPRKSRSSCSFRPLSSFSSKYSKDSDISVAKQLSLRSGDHTSGPNLTRSKQFLEVEESHSQCIPTENGFVPLWRPTTAKSSTNGSVRQTGLRLPIRGASAPAGGRKMSLSINQRSLSETKSLMNSQVRINKKPIKREKLLLEVGVIESRKHYDSPVVQNTAVNTLSIETGAITLPQSDSSIGSNEDSQEEVMITKNYIMSETIIVPIENLSLRVQPHQSIHPKRIASTIPQGGHNRPKTAHSRVSSRTHIRVRSPRRCNSAVSSRTQTWNNSTTSSPLRKKTFHGWTTSCTESTLIPPMLMHRKSDVEAKNTGKQTMKQKVNPTLEVKNPFESHGEFHLRSRQQMEEYLQSVCKIQTLHDAREEREREKMKKVVWKAKATGKTK